MKDGFAVAKRLHALRIWWVALAVAPLFGVSPRQIKALLDELTRKADSA